MILEELSSSTLSIANQLFSEIWDEASDIERHMSNVHRILISERETVFLGRIGEEYIGFIYLSMRLDYVEGATISPVAYVEGIYVRSAFQKKGLGRQFMEWAEQWAISKGFTELGSDTDLSNTNSIAFHKQMGFKEADRIVCFVKRLEDA